MKILNRYTIILILLFTLLTSNIYSEKITFSADSMSGTAGESNGKTVLSGNAHITTKNMEISADSIELSGKDYRFISAKGNINGKNLESKLTFTCDTMTYDRETTIASLQNGVHLIDEENKVTADAELIEYNQNTNIAIMQIQVSLIQDNNKCTAAYAIYRKNDQLLEMSGNPNITQGEDTFRAQNITLNLDTQEITLDGRVKGSVTSQTKTEETELNEQTSQTETTETKE